MQATAMTANSNVNTKQTKTLAGTVRFMPFVCMFDIDVCVSDQYWCMCLRIFGINLHAWNVTLHVTFQISPASRQNILLVPHRRSSGNQCLEAFLKAPLSPNKTSMRCTNCANRNAPLLVAADELDRQFIMNHLWECKSYTPNYHMNHFDMWKFSPWWYILWDDYKFVSQYIPSWAKVPNAKMIHVTGMGICFTFTWARSKPVFCKQAVITWRMTSLELIAWW